MESNVERKIIGMLDVLASGLVDFRTEFTNFRTEMYEFHAETSANFNRIERRLDNHETRIESLEHRGTVEAS